MVPSYYLFILFPLLSMSKKTLAILGASLFFAACTHSSMMKKEVPAPVVAPISSSVMSAPAAPVAVTGAMMQSSSVMSVPAAMEKVDAMKK